MKAVFWRLAAACLVLIGLALGTAPVMLAADPPTPPCQTIEQETKLANTYNWKQTRVLEGDRAGDFLGRYNNEPPVSTLKADTIYFFRKEGQVQTGVIFLFEGCVVKREFMGPFILDRLLGGPSA